ncbi:uncharacterized protein LOC115769022 [Drosophila novamexicana]|uniref:uncharacterized protein LOC115769022 n=1 Tax=Drosophila novamexicana TaxID=47314 RepID=UPI0011E5F198|nr:uncharacterized protein LOC115769022 [Drosophila novamexicana]
MLRTFSIWLLFVAGALAVCDLNLMEPKPIVVKRFGSKTAIVKRALTSLQMSTNETVTFHCPTGISINRNTGQSLNINAATAELLCTDNGVYLDDRQIIQQRSGAFISCSADYSQTLYESNHSLTGCDADAMTLLVGYRLQALPDVKLLGMCYDLGASRLRFVSFLAYAPRNALLEMHTDHELAALQLDSYIGSLTKYFRFPTKSEFQTQVDRQKRLGELYDGKLFEYESLLQDTQQIQELNGYTDMLSIVWLRALRSGNWLHWLNALRSAASGGGVGDDEDVAGSRFDVRVGVSGVATLPVAHSCNASRPLLLEKIGDNTLQVPAHIWAHVRALQPSPTVPDEFVIVAHNSPYFNVLELSSFCEDICAEIPWLSNTLFGQLHLVPSYGVVSCCRMDQLQKLSDFPLAPAALPAPTAVVSTPISLI